MALGLDEATSSNIPRILDEVTSSNPILDNHKVFFNEENIRNKIGKYLICFFNFTAIGGSWLNDGVCCFVRARNLGFFCKWLVFRIGYHPLDLPIGPRIQKHV